MGRVDDIARNALCRLGEPAAGFPGPGANAGEVRLGPPLSMAQLSRLVYLQAGDPLVDRVLAALRSDRPVFLDRPAVEASLGLDRYPPRLREQFQRWFSRLSGYGIALTSAAGGAAPRTPAPPSAPRPASEAEPPPPQVVSSSVLPRPEFQIFSEILGEAVPEPHACVKEPGRPCCGSGRCKTLGY